MPTVLFAASVVPILEELLFRGFILGVLLRSFSRLGALLLTSALFSIIHFLKAPELTTPNDSVSWSLRFRLDRAFLLAIWRPAFCSPPVSSPFSSIACILADARLRTRSLWFPIGLHAGWIFANGIFSKAAHREALALPWLGKDLLVGIAPLTHRARQLGAHASAGSNMPAPALPNPFRGLVSLFYPAFLRGLRRRRSSQGEILCAILRR